MHYSMRMIPKEASPPNATSKLEVHGSDSVVVPRPSKQMGGPTQ